MLSVEILDWLQTEDGERAVGEAQRHLGDPVAAVSALRRVWTREQSAAALQQAGLRRRGARKFAHAGRMLFEAEALEQASGETIAAWRAARFRPFDRIADLCCGIGGDTLAFARVAWTVGIDRDPVRLALARANAAALGLAGRCAFVRGRVPEVALRLPAAFIDPDRRPDQERTRSLERMQPSLREILTLQQQTPNLGVKLSPALDEAELASYLTPRRHELEFISERGVCKEAVLWLGDLPTACRRASVLPWGAVLTDADPSEEAIQSPGAYLFEPDAAVIRAHLVEQAAAAIGGWRLDAQVALLSTDRPVSSPLVKCYRIYEAMRPNVKEIGRWLRLRGYGRVVVKRRAAAVEPEEVLRRLQTALAPDSSREAVALFTRLGDRRIAFLCEEVKAGIRDP